MPKRILVIQGHPDPSENHLCHALANAYVDGAEQAGHSVTTIKVAQLDFPLLRTESDFNEGTPVPDIAEAQSLILQSEHLVIIYPLWMGSVPAIFQGFFEQVFRPGFAIGLPDDKAPVKRLKGKSVHIVVTMGMPAFIYRWYFGAHSLKALERNILKFCGISPVWKTVFGGVKSGSDAKREKWLTQMQTAGRRGR